MDKQNTEENDGKRKRRRSYVVDLRIHSPTSLAYLGIEGIDTAPAMVRLAKVKGLDVIAVTDYYSYKYVDRILEAAKETKITVLPGVVIRCEIPSCNDINLAVLFNDEKDSTIVKNFLNRLAVPESAEGDEKYIVQKEFSEILNVIEEFDALVIPSRMDKTPHRKNAIKILVEDYGFRAFDLAYFPDSTKIFKQNWPNTEFELLSFSNANALAQIGSRISKVKMHKPGFSGLRDITARSK